MESKETSSKSSFVLDDQGQAELLKEAAHNVRDHGFRMKRAMDASELGSVLKHAAEMLRELRTSLLSPKNYYDLYMQVLDELRYFETYVEDLQKQGASIRSLYERVQSSGNVLPRLYLLITVGSVFIKSKEAPANEVLTDLVEMTKGVQHPLRGLFLRNYLLAIAKDKLPDAGSEYEGAGGSTEDAISFLLNNFSEMNRLWIRMQNQKVGAVKDRATREKERQELRILVGTSLVRLSQLEGITVAVVGSQVLPKIIDIIVCCKDKLAQEYLMDCIIQVFPDEYHLKNLDKLLEATERLHDAVDSAQILVTLLERITKFRETLTDTTVMFKSDNATPDEVQESIFRSLMKTATKIIAKTNRLEDTGSVASVFKLFVALTSFTIACFGHPRTTPTTRSERAHVTYLKEIADAMLKFAQDQPGGVDTNEGGQRIKQFLLLLLDDLSVPELHEVDAIMELTKHLAWKPTRKRVMMEWIHTLLHRNDAIARTADAELVLEMLVPLIRDDPNDQPLAADPVSSLKDEFEAEQLQLTKVVHLFTCDDLDVKFRMYTAARRAFGQGGVFRIRYSLLPLIFDSLQLVRQLEQRKTETFTTTAREVLQFIHEMVTALASKLEQMSVTCVNLFLQCALVADGCNIEAIAYEFITQAFIVYEDQITNSREQWKALELMVAGVRSMNQLSSSNYEVLATKITQYAAKLLKKHDQASIVLHCAHLFWHPVHQDGKRVLECLQRALRIADASSATSGGAVSKVSLFLDILESYLYFFEAKTPEVTANYLAGLFALVKEHLENMEHGSTRNECELRYREIRRYVDSKALGIA